MFGECAWVTPLALQVAEDGGDDIGVENEGEDAHLTATLHASEWTDFENPLQHFRPALSGRPQRRPVGDVDEEPGEKLERREDVCSGGGAFALVKLKGDLLPGGVVARTLEAKRGASRIAGKLQDAARVVGFDAHRVVDVKARAVVIPSLIKTPLFGGS